MKRGILKITSTVLASTMLFAMAACSKKDNSAKETEAPKEKPVQTFSEELTYPDHIADISEVHPEHTPGNVKGQEAKDLLNEVEHDVLVKSMNNYADIVLLFDDPEAFGLSVDEVSWGHITTEPDTEYIDSVLDRLYSIDYEDLDNDDRLFYDKILFDFEESRYGSQFTAFEYYDSILNPLTSVQCNILFVLDIFEINSIKDAENYITMVRDTDRYFDEIMDFEEERAEKGFWSTDDIYENTAVSFDNLAAQKDTCFLYRSFEEKVSGIDGISDAEKERLVAENEDAMKNSFFPEMEECAQRLRALKQGKGLDGGICRFPGGDAYFAFKVRHLSNSSKTMEQNMTDASDLMAAVKAEATSQAQTVMKDEEMMGRYTNHMYGSTDTQENLDLLTDAVKADFPELPDHDYRLLNVPDELKDNFSPAAYLGYHLDTNDSNLIITNQAAVTGDFGVICAHEGYPGHMFQSVFTRNSTAHPYMYIVDNIGYKEGWAVYVENYSYKYFGEEDSVMTMVRCDNQFGKILWAILDYGVNYEGWDAQDFADYMTKLQGQKFTVDRVQDMYYIVVADPGYGVKYGSGYINTLQIMNRARENHPEKTETEIHEAYLLSLTGTFEQIEANMDRLLSN